MLVSVHIEFPNGKVTVYKEGSDNPSLEGYKVYNIDNRTTSGSRVMVYSKNENGDEMSQAFNNVPYVFVQDEEGSNRWEI